VNNSDKLQSLRDQMVETQLKARGIYDPRVLDAMRRIPRHEFTPPQHRHLAYEDQALLIGENQTISQPYIVGLMTQMLRLSGHERILEVGTGSGYQTAILCSLAAHVYTLEYYPQLADRASRVLARLKINNVDLHIGDGSQGLADMAPFDAIIVSAAAPALPGPLRSQLDSRGGRLVLPIGDRSEQHLEIVTRQGNRWEMEQTIRVRFVPLIGRYGFKTAVRRDSPQNDDQAAGV
jgi:protein-L-isoaspartate(D-aspartate) O-methyltransferase